MQGQSFFHQAIRQTGVWPDGVTLHHETSGKGWDKRKVSVSTRILASRKTELTGKADRRVGSCRFVGCRCRFADDPRVSPLSAPPWNTKMVLKKMFGRQRQPHCPCLETLSLESGRTKQEAESR